MYVGTCIKLYCVLEATGHYRALVVTADSVTTSTIGYILIINLYV